jgi:hypothetical protein
LGKQTPGLHHHYADSVAKILQGKASKTQSSTNPTSHRSAGQGNTEKEDKAYVVGGALIKAIVAGPS